MRWPATCLATRRRRWTTGLALLTALALFGCWLPGALLRFMVVNDAPPRVTAIVPLGGESAARFVAGLVKAGRSDHVVIFEIFPERVSQYQIMPPRAETSRQVMLSMGLQNDQIEIIPGQPYNLFRFLKALGGWLERHPQPTVAITADHLGGRALRAAIQQTLPAELAARVFVIAVPEQGFHDDRWWRERYGVRSMAINLINWALPNSLARDYPLRLWDFDAYERGLRAAR
ncbi:MAG: hypothetical protein JSS27_21350 [Planctomycetes bacterium]|nr:hypothetical protein [Planctomycetota bacterium]